MITAMKKRYPRPSDSNQLAKFVVDMATGQIPHDRDLPENQPDAEPDKEVDAETVSEVMSQMGRKGGLKGGKARAKALTPERRKEIAQKAAKARWEKDGE